MCLRSDVALAVLAAAAVAAATPAAGAPRVAIGGVRNDADGAIAASLASAVCPPLECVPAARVLAGKRIDFAVARRSRVEAVLFGTVAARGGGRVLALALLRDSFKPVKSWSLRVDAAGRVDAADVGDEIAALLAPAAAPAVAEVRPAPAPAPEVRAAAPPPAEAASPRPRVAPATERAAGPRERGALSLGMLMLQRTLAFEGVPATGPAPQGLSGGTLVTPTLAIEVFPWAGAAGWSGGLGGFGSYGRSVGFETEEPGGGKHAAQYTALEAGVAYRVTPSAAPRLTLTPTLSYRRVTFEIATRTAAIAGLPDSALAGPALGLDAALAVGGRWRVLASAGYTLWTTADDVVGGGGFSTSGSAYALAGAAGLSVALARGFSAEVVAEYEWTRYSLSGAGLFSTTGATDAFLGARAAVRKAF